MAQKIDNGSDDLYSSNNPKEWKERLSDVIKSYWLLDIDKLIKKLSQKEKYKNFKEYEYQIYLILLLLGQNTTKIESGTGQKSLKGKIANLRRLLIEFLQTEHRFSNDDNSRSWLNILFFIKKIYCLEQKISKSEHKIEISFKGVIDFASLDRLLGALPLKQYDLKIVDIKQDVDNDNE